MVLTLKQITFAIRAMRNPTHLPEFMARLNLVQTSARSVAQSINGLLINGNNVHSNLDAIRKTYEAGAIANVVVDGTLPFSMDTSKGKSGIMLEFRYALIVTCLVIVLKSLQECFLQVSRCSRLFTPQCLVPVTPGTTLRQLGS